MTIPFETIKQIPDALLDWYDKNARPLPWRKEHKPYHVWISEIMLQQTRMEAALPYYNCFIKALPDISSLAVADEELLLKLWEGLGYYSRVRNLQKAAKIVIEEYNGELPAEYHLLLKLPGIGEYTAGAVASIAYNIPVPAVDGNVLRVFARILADRTDISLPEVKKGYAAEVAKIIPPNRAGDFNQALMELGATVCLPNGNPLCERCPLSELCEGRKQGIAEGLPVKAGKATRKLEKRTVFIVLSDGKVLLHRRENKGLLAGLWEFPNAEGWLTEKQGMQEIQRYGLNAGSIFPAEPAKHIFSHIEWHMKGYMVMVEKAPPPKDCIWSDADEVISKYAVANAFQAYRKRFLNNTCKNSE